MLDRARLRLAVKRWEPRVCEAQTDSSGTPIFVAANRDHGENSPNVTFRASPGRGVPYELLCVAIPSVWSVAFSGMTRSRSD